jgi:hypothetical protein
LKWLINNQATGCEIGRAARHELLKPDILRHASTLRMQNARRAARVSPVGDELDNGAAGRARREARDSDF